MERQTILMGTPWEPIVGYARAVRVGNQVFLSGMTPTDEKMQLVGRGDPYLQAQQCIRNIGWALERAGGSLRDVVRTRILLTDIRHWEQAGKAHREAFADIKPANITMAVGAFVNPDILVEIESDAALQR